MPKTFWTCSKDFAKERGKAKKWLTTANSERKFAKLKALKSRQKRFYEKSVAFHRNGIKRANLHFTTPSTSSIHKSKSAAC